jgi:hypothetical protein
MPAPTQTPEASETDTKTGDAPRPNGMTDEQVRYALAALGRRKNDPEYLRRLEEGIAEYRKTIQEELEREGDGLHDGQSDKGGNSMTTIQETLETQKERLKIALERIAERKDDPEYQNYVEELFREAKEARRRINEEELRQMENRK